MRLLFNVVTQVHGIGPRLIEERGRLTECSSPYVAFG